MNMLRATLAAVCIASLAVACDSESTSEDYYSPKHEDITMHTNVLNIELLAYEKKAADDGLNLRLMIRDAMADCSIAAYPAFGCWNDEETTPEDFVWAHLYEIFEWRELALNQSIYSSSSTVVYGQHQAADYYVLVALVTRARDNYHFDKTPNIRIFGTYKKKEKVGCINPDQKAGVCVIPVHDIYEFFRWSTKATKKARRIVINSIIHELAHGFLPDNNDAHYTHAGEGGDCCPLWPYTSNRWDFCTDIDKPDYDPYCNSEVFNGHRQQIRAFQYQ